MYFMRYFPFKAPFNWESAFEFVLLFCYFYQLLVPLISSLIEILAKACSSCCCFCVTLLCCSCCAEFSLGQEAQHFPIVNADLLKQPVFSHPITRDIVKLNLWTMDKMSRLHSLRVDESRRLAAGLATKEGVLRQAMIVSYQCMVGMTLGPDVLNSVKFADVVKRTTASSDKLAATFKETQLHLLVNRVRAMFKLEPLPEWTVATS